MSFHCFYLVSSHFYYRHFQTNVYNNIFPSNSLIKDVSLSGVWIWNSESIWIYFSPKLTSHKLDSSCHSADGTWYDVWHAAGHECCEGHEQQQATPSSCHHRTDPPLHTGDAEERGIASTMLHHHRAMDLILHRVWAAPECPKRYRLPHLRAQEPEGHEESHTGGDSAQKRDQSP